MLNCFPPAYARDRLDGRNGDTGARLDRCDIGANVISVCDWIFSPGRRGASRAEYDNLDGWCRRGIRLQIFQGKLRGFLAPDQKLLTRRRADHFHEWHQIPMARVHAVHMRSHAPYPGMRFIPVPAMVAATAVITRVAHG